MSSSREQTGSAPRIVVALPEGPLRDRLLALLADRDLDVDSPMPPPKLGARIQQSESDVVIVRREDLSEDDRRRLDSIAADENAPDVVVMAPDPAEADRVDLVQAGATEVIDAAQLDVRAADVIETLATGEGGHGAPDTRGGPEPSLSDFASHSKPMQALLDLVQRVAPTDSTLLISGETGVGKEHLARAVHAASRRSEGPFVAVNCGALPRDLLESELFGHAAGAFTGAKGARRGYFQSADGGTLLLDEIGEMPLHLQVRLLRVLQRGEIRPVGADADILLDVRIMAATNRDLRQDVAEGAFREDLFYRLNVVELAIPPLRDRPEDLPTLIGSLVRHFRGRMARDDIDGLDGEAIEALLRYGWQGNVRELIHALERAMLVSRGPRIGLADLPKAITAPREGDEASLLEGGTLPDALRQLPWSEVRETVLRVVERSYFEALLAQSKGAVGETAERAGLSNRSLYEKMKRHGLRKEDYR